MRISRATAVVVQRVPAAGVAWFMEWQQGVTEAAQTFRGHRGTDVYPPAGGQGGDWVAVVNFEDEAALKDWLDSPVRRAWVEKLQARIGTFDLKVVPGGFGPWFAGCLHGRDAAPPPGWKMVLVVLLGLYPTVMLLTLFPGPYTQPLGLAVAMLIGNALSVCALQWGVMPLVTRLAAPWLAANSDSARGLSMAGTLVIAGLLAVLTLLFRQITG
ncbi:antibiotic biosynthesis monooxygenase [Solidesulfovibrio sp.]